MPRLSLPSQALPYLIWFLLPLKSTLSGPQGTNETPSRASPESHLSEDRGCP